jgi:glucokinase
MSERVVVAIDLGGTKASVAVVTESGRLLGRSVAPAPRTPPREAVTGFAERARRLPGVERALAVGLAVPGIVSGDGRIEWAAPSIAAWQDAAAADLLAAAFGLPATVEFDGYAAAMGEAVFGPGRGRRNQVTLIIGTGFGAGVWLDGRVVRGRSGVAGAVGWDRWPLPDGSLSAPAEAICSGPGILAAARARDPGTPFEDARAVFRLARRGHAVARTVIREAATVAGVVAGSAVDLLAPELIVWSGGVGSRADFSALATSVARRSCQPFAVRRTDFIRSRLGVESSLMGAAAGALAALEGSRT